MSRTFSKICFSKSCLLSWVTKQTYFGSFTCLQTHFGCPKLSDECCYTTGFLGVQLSQLMFSTGSTSLSVLFLFLLGYTTGVLGIQLSQLMFLTGLTSLCVLFLFPLSITLVFVHGFQCYFI